MSSLGDGIPPPDPLQRWVDDAEVAAILGGPADAVVPLTHNPLNAVTGGIWRVDADGHRAACKVLTDGSSHDGPTWWAASDDDPTHWNWWRREARAYAEDLAGRFRPDGIDAPGLLALHERGEGAVVLWLEWVDGRSAADLTLPDLVELARRLGRAQARLAADGPDGDALHTTRWLSRDYLARYSASKPVDTARLADDRIWAHPRVAAHLGHLRDDLVRLHRDRHRHLALAARCPRTLCHLDVWPANVSRRPDGDFVLFDWSFCGDGALGEDVANLIPDAVFDLLLPVDVLDELAESAEAAFLAGLREAGWSGDERWVRLGIRAAAVKYHWLVNTLLTDPDREKSRVYGGRLVPTDEMYHARATGLALLCRWADEADALAAELGVTA